MMGKPIAAITGEWLLAHNSPVLGEARYNFVDFGIASGPQTLQHVLRVTTSAVQIVT